MPDLELVRSQWAPGCWEIIYDVRYKSDLNIWINKFCPRIHGYRYTQKRWSSMIRDVWKSETFFTISSPGRQGVGGLGLWRGNNPLWEVYLIQFTINGWCKNRFWWQFHQFYCSTCFCPVWTPRSGSLPPWSPSLAWRHLEQTIYSEMRIIISIVSKHKWIVISPSSWDLNLLISVR